MERIVYGWQTAGVCDRLTAMLLIHCVAQKTGRKPLWHWVTNRNCDGYFGHNFDGLDQVIRPCKAVDRLVTQFMEWNWRDKMIGVHIRRTDRSDCGPPGAGIAQKEDTNDPHDRVLC